MSCPASMIRLYRCLFLLPLLATAALAQQGPPRSDATGRVQQLLQGSGMTPEQIRSRLQAQGYPQSLLDSYLPGSSGPAAAPNENVFAAVAALGLATSGAIDTL